MKYDYPVTLTENSVNGGYVVTCRDLPEVITQGETVEEALVAATDALDEANCGCINHGRDTFDPSVNQVNEHLVSLPEMTVRKVEAYKK